METNSLPIELDPYHFNTYDGQNSFCLHTRNDKPCLWNSCQDIQIKPPINPPNLDFVRIIDLKLTQGFKNSNITKDVLKYIIDFLKNEQFLKTLHIQNWSWQKERESIFDMIDFDIIINALNDHDFTDHNIKLEIVNKEKESLESELLNIEKNKEKIFENQKLIIDLQSKEKELQNKIKEKTEKLNKVDELQKSAIKKDEEKLKIIKYEIEEFTKKAINAEMQAKELAEEAKQAKELAEEAKKVKKEAKKVKKEAEEEAKQAKELAEEAKKVKEEFVYFTKRVESAEKEEKRIQEDIQNGETYRKAREQEELLLKQIKEEQAEEAKKLIDNEKKNNLLMVKNQKLIDENYDLEDAKKISEEFSKKFDKNEMQILAYINLKNNVLKNCVQMIIKKAGFGSNSELMSLNERVIREQFIEPIVSFKPDDPYEDLRFMIKILLRSKDLIKVAPALHKLMNYEINKYLKILLQHLNNDAHSNKNEYTDEEILELGMLIIELISNFISTENYEFDEENILREFINEAEGLVRPFKDSLNF